VISRENYDDDLPHATLYCDGLKHDQGPGDGAARDHGLRGRAPLRHLVGGLAGASGWRANLIKATANFAIFEIAVPTASRSSTMVRPATST